MVQVIEQSSAGDFKIATNGRKWNPQQIMQQNVKDAIRRIEKDLEDSGCQPIDQFKGAAVLAKLVDYLEQSIQNRVKQAQGNAGLGRYPLIAQLLRNERNAITPMLLTSPCHEACNRLYDCLKSNGTTGAVFRRGGFQRELSA